MEISRSGQAACYPDLSWGRVQLFQVPEQRGGLRGPTRARGEATGEAPKGQEDSSRLWGAGADRLRKVSERACHPPGDRGEPVEPSPAGDTGCRRPTSSPEVTHLGLRKRAAVCCRSLGEGCPQGPGSLAVQAHHRGLQNGLQQPGKVLLAKKPRFWQRKRR